MPRKFNHARRHQFEKAIYRVSNWADYEAGLRRRGDVTFWISESAIPGCITSPGERGIYSSLAIEATLDLRLVFGLALRQTKGFVASLLRLLELDLPVPDHKTLSRRGPGLELAARRVPKTGTLDIIVDSTGLRIFGPGEWFAERHGGSKRREWRKLHLGLDPKRGQLVARDLTRRYVANVTALPGLLNQIDGRIESLLDDPAYDGQPHYYQLINRRQQLLLPRVVIPPRRSAGGAAPKDDDLSQRSRHTRNIASYGRMVWQKVSGYNSRALVKAAISRYKRIIGGRLRARTLPTQQTEVAIAVQVLNRMTELGMPTTE